MNRELKNKILLLAQSDLALRNIDIAKKTKQTAQRISNYINNKESIPDKFIDTFSIAYNIDVDSYKEKVLNQGHVIINNDPTESQQIQKGVPYYPMDVTGSIVGSFQDIKERPEYFIDFRPFNDCDAWLTVYGDSMFPKYSSGDMVAVKQVRKYFQSGEAYLVVTKPEADDLRTIKLVFNHDTDTTKVILRASNPQFKGDLIVDRDDILSMWIIKGKVNRSQL